MKILYCGMILLLILMAVISWLHWRGYGISYQNTGSMPQGWYWLFPVPTHLQRGDIVLFQAPQPSKQLALEHHWMLPGEIFMKPIAALADDQVCVRDHQIWINHQPVARQQSDYAPYHSLPQWKFCGTIPAGYYLLLSTYDKRSFDGRYFGLIKKSALVARALFVGRLFNDTKHIKS